MAVSNDIRNAGGLYAPYWQGDNTEIFYTDFISSYMPTTDDARNYLKEKT
jgi:hypothetical protein